MCPKAPSSGPKTRLLVTIGSRRPLLPRPHCPTRRRPPPFHLPLLHSFACTALLSGAFALVHSLPCPSHLLHVFLSVAHPDPAPLLLLCPPFMLHCALISLSAAHHLPSQFHGLPSLPSSMLLQSSFGLQDTSGVIRSQPELASGSWRLATSQLGLKRWASLVHLNIELAFPP